MDKEIIERIQEKAKIFLDNDIPAFIKDIKDNYFFCDILFVGEIYLMIYDFKRKEKFKLYWQDILVFDEYKERGEMK